MSEDGWRVSALWSIPGRRRDVIPRYASSLSRAQTRTYRCRTCNKTFYSVKNMERHVALTHTGTKPVLCPVCDKRFDSRYHMLSHYPVHRESDLSQVESFRRRRNAHSEPMSSLTSVGSIHGISRRMKNYLSEPTYKSFGTKQSYFVSEKERERFKQEQKSLRVHTSGSDHDGGLRNGSSRTRSSVSGIPRVNAESLSAIGSVMGPSPSIVTDKRSHFLQSAEDRLVKSRIADISLAGWTVSTPSNGSRPTVTWGSVQHYPWTR